MRLSLDLSKPKNQFIIGLTINILFLIILYSFSSSYANIQIPVGKYECNMWNGTDVLSYVTPAINFVTTGTFGYGTAPDYMRTIGYPAFISFFYFVFGSHWLLALQLFQAVVYAFIYPLITLIIGIFFPGPNEKLIKVVFVLMCLTGTYFTRVPILCTDTLFTLLFMAGFYYGLETYITGKYKHLFLFIFFITIGALVRPTLGFFPIVNLVIAYWVAKKYKLAFKKLFTKSILVSLVLLALINISTIRNYINYSFPSSSSIAGINAFSYLSKKILINANKSNEFDTDCVKINSLPDITQKTNLREKIMLITITKYPLATFNILSKSVETTFLSNSLVTVVANYFNYDIKPYYTLCYKEDGSKALLFLTYVFKLFYAVVWLLFFLSLIALWRRNDYVTLLLLALLFIMFVVPAILTCVDGSRLRLTFEFILFIFGFSTIFYKNKTSN